MIVVSDLHGRYDLYYKFKKLWDDKIVFLGDFIDCNGDYPDESIKILDDMKKEDDENFIILSANHEASHYMGGYLYSNNSLLLKCLKREIRNKNKGKLQPYYNEYVEFMKSLPLYHITENNIFLSHAGPATSMKKNITFDFTSFVWNYMDEVEDKDVEQFLKIHNLEGMVTGHNHYNKQRGRMLTFNSMNGWYLEFDESMDINGSDLEKYLKRIEV